MIAPTICTQLVKSLKLLATLCLISTLFACAEEDPVLDIEIPLSEAEIREQQEREILEQQRAKWPKEVRWETYGDAEIFSTPRVQYTAIKEGEDGKTIWSMRLDGSDRRRVVDTNMLQLNGKRIGIIHTPVRSPDNRYIAISSSHDDTRFRALIDLKTKELIKIHDGDGYPSFTWTLDSETVIFHSDFKIWNYHVPSKTLKETPSFKSKYFNAITKNIILGISSNSFKIMSLDGKIQKEYEYGNDCYFSSGTPSISPNKEILLINSDLNICWFNIRTGEFLGKGKSKQLSFRKSAPLFDIQPLSLRTYDFQQTYITDLTSKSISEYTLLEIGIWDTDSPDQLQIINYDNPSL